jgi:uncharacterized protein YdhG (YjbR/CyaY superfamily)
MADFTPSCSSGETMRATTLADYLEPLAPDRREAVTAVLDTMRAHMPTGYAEGMGYGMPGFFVPHTIYPAGYQCNPTDPVPFVGVASQKQYISIYLFCIYIDEALKNRFFESMAARSVKANIGKGCVRFRHARDIPHDLIGDVIAASPVDAFIAAYEASIPPSARKGRRA